MNGQMIKNWNSVVKPNDLVYILGDFTWNHDMESYKKLLASLNGEKILIKGNHDKISEIKAINVGYRAMVREAVIKIGKYHLRLSHYPYKESIVRYYWGKFLKYIGIRDWSTRYRELRAEKSKMWHLHGHTHQKTKLNGNQIHIGVDAWYYFPVSSNKIIEMIRKSEGK